MQQEIPVNISRVVEEDDKANKPLTTHEDQTVPATKAISTSSRELEGYSE